MDKLLLVHTEGKFEQFRLIYDNISGIDGSRVCKWISAALCRGVEEIVLIDFPMFNYIPVLLTALFFSSKSLVRLKLGIPFVMTVRVHVCLPRLKTLKLESVIFEDDESLNKLISSFPVLEDLSISKCDMSNMKYPKISNPSLQSLTLVFKLIPLTFDIVIDVPSLVYFKYEGFTANSYSMGNLPSLVSADVYFSFGDLSMSSKSVGFVKLFEGIGNVKSLHLTIGPKSLAFLSHNRFVAHQNLLFLEIIDRCGDFKGTELLGFLEFSPNLHTLHTLVIRYLSDQAKA